MDELPDVNTQAFAADTLLLNEEARIEKLHTLIAIVTPRELEVLRYVINGKLNKEIAHELGIAEKTVKIHRGHVMTKMKVSSVAELVRIAQQADIEPRVLPPLKSPTFGEDVA